MPYDLKYGQVTTERGTIPDDEPVVVFRAQDRMLPYLLTAYMALCRDAGSPPLHLDLIRASIRAVEIWQESHTTKVPTSDSFVPPTAQD